MPRLYDLTPDGTLTWHCVNPICDYHHCSGWHPHETCLYHPNKEKSGQVRTAHISHEAIQHVTLPTGEKDKGTIALPQCACGAYDFLNVNIAPEDLNAFRIIKDEMTGRIAKVEVTGFDNYVVVKKHVERTLLPLTDSDIKAGNEQVITWKDGKLYKVIYSLVVDSAVPAPWLAHHLKLAELMKQHGKGP